MTAHNAVDLTGQRFGFLVALRREGRQRTNALWRCRCDCGQEIRIRVDWLRAGRKKACRIGGHVWIRANAPGLTVKYASEYATWRKMHERCEYPKNKNWKHYGGRGIKVCERWSSFAAFFDDLGPKPARGYTIERKDTNGHYEKENCRWATNAEQQRNKRTSVFVEYEGERMLLLDVVAKLGLKRGIVYQRLKLGWPLEQALSVPVREKKTKK